MRSSRALVLVVGAAAACAQSGGPAPVPGPTGTGDPAPTTRIADVDVRTEDRGAWTYRVAGRDGRRALGGLRSEAKGEDGVFLADAEAPAAGGIAAPGAPPPTASAPARAPASDPAGRPVGGPFPAKAPAEPREVELSRVAHDSPGTSGGETARPSVPLRAGTTDDNEDLPAFLRFLDDWTGQDRLAGQFQPMDVRDRVFVRVVDSRGRPVPAARVTVLDEAADRLVTEGTTYGDGRVPVYARLSAKDGKAPASFVVEARKGTASVRRTFSAATAGEFELRLDADLPPADPVPLDVAFLIDTTGSMGDEIASIQDCLLRVTSKIRGLARESDLRYATVLYRDVGDEYLTATHAFTSDVDALDKALRDVRADGGGDGPESLNQGLSDAVNGLQWRDGAAKVVFLIADAPPHMDYKGDTPYGETCVRAVAKGVRIHTVAASGLDGAGTVVFRQIAQFTRGRFVFLEYGVPGTADDAKGHGVAGAVKNDNLEDVIFERIRDEVARWGR